MNKLHGISKKSTISLILVLPVLVVESGNNYTRVAEYKDGLKFGKETFYGTKSSSKKNKKGKKASTEENKEEGPL